MNDRLPYIIAVDFDGTLVEDKFPDIGEKRAPKLWESLIRAKETHGDHVQIILWTCRNGDHLEPAVLFCQRHGLYPDRVNDNIPEVLDKYGGPNRLNTRKVYANIYIDDKNGSDIDDFDNIMDLLKPNSKKNPYDDYE